MQAAARIGAPLRFSRKARFPREWNDRPPPGLLLTKVNDTMAARWYSVSVLSNFEKKIAEQIRAKVGEQGLEDQIDEVLAFRRCRARISFV